MKAIVAVYVVIMTCSLTHSYPAKRRISNMPMAYAQIMPQYYDRSGVSSSNSYLQPQSVYLSNPYPKLQPQQLQKQKQQPQRIADDYNRNYLYQSQRDYQEPLYGYPTFHGDYSPKPYYFAQPSYMTQEDQMEATNPLDYLQAEIIQENERERNNAAFMQNLALYNQKLDSLQGRQEKLQKFEDAYKLMPTKEYDDYEVDQPSDWYDYTAVEGEPNAVDDVISIETAPQFQYAQWQPHSSDYDDEMVKELRNLKQETRNMKKGRQQRRIKSYGNLDWQQDMPQTNNEKDDDVIEPENYDDEWINWGGQKRSIQPKKEAGEIKQQQKGTSTVAPTTTEKSKTPAKLQLNIRGQKEVVLPRPATPVRRPFSEAIMKTMESQDVKSEQQQTPPIYRTIKQIIDMEQNLSHLSDNQLPTSKIRKRFVTNEESLAQQLNGLKRTSK